MTCYTPQNCMIKLVPAQFHCNFPLYHCLEHFCGRFEMPSRLFFLYNLVLCYSLCIRIVVQFVDQRKFPLSSWPHLFREMFALNRQTLLSVSVYPTLSPTFLSNRARYGRSQIDFWRVILGFRREVDEIYALLGYYAARSGNYSPTFRDNQSVPWSLTERMSRNVGKQLPLLAA